MDELLYGSGGAQLLECMRLRVKDMDLERRIITARAGKGNKDRRVPLPEKAVEPSREHLSGPVRQLCKANLEDSSLAGVHLPDAHSTKSPNAGRE